MAIIAVAAFATERIQAMVTYLMNAVRVARAQPNLVKGLRAKERRKIVLFLVAALIAYGVVDRANLRLFRVLQVDNIQPMFDFWMTWLVVLAGSDRVRSLLGNSSSTPQKPAAAPAVRLVVDGEVQNLRRAS
ncbi:MAG TPA: hypothetical protein VN380_26470 [Thermoanaerobaculia bacterium]|nr:hypothetical protein [Thermoanaerobaculia bacterium]